MFSIDGLHDGFETSHLLPVRKYPGIGPVGEGKLLRMGIKTLGQSARMPVEHLQTVTLKMRYADFMTITRARSFPPTHSELDIYPLVRELFEENRTRDFRIRLLGIALSNLGHFDGQLNLFEANHHDLHSAIDRIRQKYGCDAVHLAASRGRH